MRRSCPIRPCVTMRASDGPWKPPWVASRQGSSRMTIPRARSLAWCSSRAESLHGLNDRIRAWEAQEEGRRPKIRGFKHQRTILATEVEDSSMTPPSQVWMSVPGVGIQDRVGDT